MWKGIMAVGAFAALPIIRLTANNPGEPLPIPRFVVYWLVLVSLMTALVLVGHRRSRTGADRLAASIAVATLAIVYLAVALRDGLGLTQILGVDGAIWLAALITLAGVLGTRWKVVHSFLVVMGLVLLLYPAAEIFLARDRADAMTGTAPRGALHLQAKETPNIYWFVLDGYGRSDVLERFGSTLQHDLLHDLVLRGFTVDNGASAPYPMSSLSLSSILSMDYVAGAGPNAYSEGAQYPVIQGKNATVEILRQWGYEYVLFPGLLWQGSQCGGYEDLCLEDVPLEPADWALASMTLLEVIIRPLGHDVLVDRVNPLKVVDMLDTYQPSPPFFVFAHLVNPHPPYYRKGTRCSVDASTDPNIFGSWGSHSDYLEAVRCINELMIPALDRIIAQDPHAVIVIQGDHGPPHGVDGLNASEVSLWTDEDVETRLGVLSAMRLPVSCQVPQMSTTVNTFRVIVSCLAADELQLLQPRAWIGSYQSAELIEVAPPTRYSQKR